MRMTECELAEARRLMLTRVPRANLAGPAPARLAPLSFSLIGVDDTGLEFRLIDGEGRMLDLLLNPVVAAALGDCIALAQDLAVAGPGPDANPYLD